MDEKAQQVSPLAVLGTLLTAIAFGTGALVVVAAGLTVPLPGTEVVTDPRELFATIGAAVTGPIGGVIIGFLAGIREPVVVLPSVFAHIAGGLWIGFGYRWLVYERLQMPYRIAGWAALVLSYYYLVVVPGFVVGQAIVQPAESGVSPALWTMLVEGYATLALGVVPEALLTTVVTGLVLLAVPRRYHRPLWAGVESRVNFSEVAGEKMGRVWDAAQERGEKGALKGIERRIRQIKGTIAWRLAILLLLMSFLPIAVMVIFVRQTVAEALVALASQETLVHARQLAAQVTMLPDETAVRSLLEASGDENRLAFILNADGRTVVMAPGKPSAGPLLDSLAPQTIREVLARREGVTAEKDSGRIVGYSPVRGNDSLAVIVMEGSTVANSIQRMETATFVQLGASLLIISLIGGGVIWLVLGPIRSLAQAAEQIGAGNFEVRINPAEMDGEMATLAAAFTRMTDRLRESYDSLERRVADRTQELATLNSISAIVSRSLDLEEVLQIAVDSTLEILDLEIGGAYRLDDEGCAMHLLAQRGLSLEFATQAAHLCVEDEATRQHLGSGRPLVVRASDYPLDTIKTYLEEEGLDTLVAVPLTSKSKLAGVIWLATGTSRQFSQQDLSLLAAIGQQVGVAMENARLYRDEQLRRRENERRRQVAESLRDILSVLNSSRPLNEILDYIVDQACRLLGSDGGLICRLQDDGKVLRVQCTSGLCPEFSPDVTVPVGDGVIGWAVLTRQPVTVPDVMAVLASGDKQTEQYGFRLYPITERPPDQLHQAMLSLPLVVKDQTYGGITLYYTQPREFSREEIELAAVFAHQAALAIENAGLRGQAEQSAIAAERSRLARDLHDAVTQTLFSASLIAEVLPRLWERSPEEGRHRLEELRQLTRGALAEMRTLLLELRPAVLAESALPDLLRQLAEAVTGRARVPVSVAIEGECQLTPDVQVAFYRIAQEALNNVAKHAAATSASVTLRRFSDRVELAVADDGKGIDVSLDAPGHLGLGIMRERAQSIGAELSITSEPGHGTRVSLVWPGPRGETT